MKKGHRRLLHSLYKYFFFFNDTATTEIYTLSLHDALPISPCRKRRPGYYRPKPLNRHRLIPGFTILGPARNGRCAAENEQQRSEEHTSELQSRQYLVCRLLLEKKNIQPLFSPLSHIPSYSF